MSFLFAEYPPTAFYFKVVFSLMGSSLDTSFQDVSGITMEKDTIDVEEGGENRFVHKLPRVSKHGNLVLKRGIAEIDSPLVTWCQTTIEGDFSDEIITMPLIVYLMNEEQVPIRGWIFDNAYPVKWEVDSFNSTKNEVVLETIELAYNTVNRVI